MSEHEDEIGVDASPEQVFTAMIDVERWPVWNQAMIRVSLLDPPPLRVGSQVRIRQPRLPAVTWTVSAVVPGRSFSWTASSAGVTSTAQHEVLPREGGCRVRLELRQSGSLAPLSGLVLARLTRRYLRMEVEGLKRYAETGSAPR